MRVRNKLFDLGVLKSRSFPLPVIAVGNITVGGSGKTPHVEYLIRLLSPRRRVAVLSRGYKRKSKGYHLALADTTMSEIGDEPFQMHRKFSDVYVAVDANRCHGIERLTSDEATRDVDVVLLDDAYQHRYVKPGLNILLTTYRRLIPYDKLLPAGRLREPQEGKSRADIVIVTKCPNGLISSDFAELTKVLDLDSHQQLYFSTLEYQSLHPLYGGTVLKLANLPASLNILLFTGIASPRQLMLDLGQYSQHITPLLFPDHHQFTAADISRLNSAFAEMPEPSIVVTTEKDASRLVGLEGLSDEVRRRIYALPICVRFLQGGAEQFDKQILSFVNKQQQ